MSLKTSVCSSPPGNPSNDPSHTTTSITMNVVGMIDEVKIIDETDSQYYGRPVLHSPIAGICGGVGGTGSQYAYGLYTGRARRFRGQRDCRASGPNSPSR